MPDADLYGYFRENPKHLRDGAHPDNAGVIGINRFWAEAMEPLFSSR